MRVPGGHGRRVRACVPAVGVPPRRRGREEELEAVEVREQLPLLQGQGPAQAAVRPGVVGEGVRDGLLLRLEVRVVELLGEWGVRRRR